MLLMCLAFAAIAFLILILWALRGNQAASGTGGSLRLNHVDASAFQNLLSEEDDEYLRSSLSGADYGKVRRARIRAEQEYLVWIAEDCATFMFLLRLDRTQTPAEVQIMVRQAIRVRLTSMALWSLLWVEYLTPALAVRPARTLAAYERFRRSAETYLGRISPQPAAGTA